MQKVKIFYHSDDFSRMGMGRSETLSALIRNQQARGSTPLAGSIVKNIKGLETVSIPLFLLFSIGKDLGKVTTSVSINLFNHLYHNLICVKTKGKPPIFLGGGVGRYPYRGDFRNLLVDDFYV